MPSDGLDRAVERAYEQTSFEMVATGAQDKYEVPVSEAARYRMETRPDPQSFKAALSKRGYAFIAPFSELSYLSSKVLDSETNEFFHIKLSGERLLVFPKNEEFSIETLERLVECVEKHVTKLELEENDE